MTLAGEVLALIQAWADIEEPDYCDSGDMLELIAGIERLCLKAEAGGAP